MEWTQQFLEQYGYWAVFIWTFIEGESVFVAAAALSAVNLMDPWKVIMVAASGAFAGHLVFFALGRWKGFKVIQSIPFLARHYPKANVILDRYAQWSIFVFQYLYGTRIVAAILFGCSSIKFWRFFLLQVINCIAWALIIYIAGHILGLAAMVILRQFGIIGLLCTLVIITATAIIIYFRFGHHHIKQQINNTEDKKNTE